MSKESFDYRYDNLIINQILEKYNGWKYTDIGSAVKYADEILTALGYASTQQAQLIAKELEREENAWMKRCESRFGLTSLLGLAGFIVAFIAAMVAIDTNSGKDTYDLGYYLISLIPVSYLQIVGVVSYAYFQIVCEFCLVALPFLVIILWFISKLRFESAGQHGDIAKIHELNHMINSWILFHEAESFNN